MRSSRLGILAFLALVVVFTTNCSYYNRIMSRKNLVDGSVAYKERKFDRAEELFRKAAERDPEGATLEGRTAQLEGEFFAVAFDTTAGRLDVWEIHPEDGTLVALVSADAIDDAMRYGVNYPRGPMEWSEQVGLQVFARALANLREHYGEERYRTSALITRKGYTGAGFHG